MLDLDLIKVILTVAIAASVVTTTTIQKIKELLNSKKYLGLIGLGVSMIVGTLFAVCFSKLEIKSCVWVGFVTWLGADALYKAFEDKIFTRFSDMNKNVVVGEIVKEAKDE